MFFGVMVARRHRWSSAQISLKPVVLGYIVDGFGWFVGGCRWFWVILAGSVV